MTAFKRDLLGRVFEREDDADGVTKFTWSVQQGRLGLLESTESPDGTKTEHWYDDFGRPTTSMWTLNAGGRVLGDDRDDAIMVLVTVPGQRWEIEFFSDNRVEIEIFYSDGKIYDREAITRLLEDYAQ